jgi:hypothetical protein
MNIKQISSKQFYLLIALLIITPFILFFGKNSSQIELFTTKFFWSACIYFLLFLIVSIFTFFFSKNYLILILFLAYLSFLQFYFLDFQGFLQIYIDRYTGYYTIFFFGFISFIAAKSSNSLVFRNFVFIMLFLNIIISVFNSIPTMEKSFYRFFKTNNIDNSSKTKNLIITKYPNIFYIIPDGLTSPKILKNYVNIDFKDSIKNFEEKGYSVPMHNYSSYNQTHLTLTALFRMDYPFTEKTSGNYENYVSGFYPEIREKNLNLIKYLKEYNYNFITFPAMWGGCPSSKDIKCLLPKANSYLEILFQDYSVITFFQSSLIYKILDFLFFKNKKDMIVANRDDTIKTALNKMNKNPEIWTEGGVFTMIHAMMPHIPYREEDCSVTDRYEAPSKEGYKSSVYCSFNRIHEISDHIIKNYPNATIVVQADHGVYPTVNTYKKFVEVPNSFIDHRMGSFTGVRGCNSNQAAELNQVHIIKYIVECLVSGKPTEQSKSKSYFRFDGVDEEIIKFVLDHKK